MPTCQRCSAFILLPAVLVHRTAASRTWRLALSDLAVSKRHALTSQTQALGLSQLSNAAMLEQQQQGSWNQVDEIKLLLGFSLAVSLLLGLVALVLRSKSPAQEEEERRHSLASNMHPLLQHLRERASKQELQQELHPETSLVEDFRLAVTPRRICVFNICLLICYLIAALTEDSSFAVSRSVPNVVSREDCQQHCKNALHAKRGICENVSFRVVKCPVKAKGSCVPEGGKEDPEVGYVKSPTCSYRVVPPEQDVVVVLCTIVMGIFLIIEGVTAELVLIGMACCFGCLGIIDEKEAFAGFASGSVLGLAFLFPVAAAVEETGVLDWLTGFLLGNPSGLRYALIRMMLPVSALSALLANTAIVTMMIPVILSWARRLDVTPSKLMMPLSFASQLGGTCTLIGSSINLVAKSAVPSSKYDMQFFDLTLPGTLLALGTMIFMVLFLPLLDGKDPQGESKETASIQAPSFAVQQAEGQQHSLYEVDFEVVPGGNQVGMASDDLKLQLERLAGVKAVNIVLGEDASTVQVGTVVECQCTEHGVVTLRRVQGLGIGNDDDLHKMGRGYDRRHRHLYEVVISPQSTMVDHHMDADVFRRVLGACPVALRGKKPAPSLIAGRTTPGATPSIGDILLLEADERFIGRDEWSREFSVTCLVHNSSPQRAGGVHDKLRCVLVCLAMLALCILQALGIVSVALGAGTFVFVLVLSNAMTIQEVYATINGPVLLVIAGAAALSGALRNTGIANFIALKVTDLAMPLGVWGIQFAVYILSAGLSMFMNNSATVAILGPMVVAIVDTSAGALSVQCLLFIVVFGAGTCLTTPLGYQTNLMVMKDGGYTFASFVRYGTPLQLVHMFMVVTFLNMLGY